MGRLRTLPEFGAEAPWGRCREGQQSAGLGLRGSRLAIRLKAASSTLRWLGGVHDHGVHLRLRSLAAWLLIAQAVVLACASFWTYLLLAWAPDEDAAAVELWDAGAADRHAGAASAVLVALAVVSAVTGVARFLGHRNGVNLFVAAHLGSALAVLLHGLPGGAVVLAVAGTAWVGVFRRDADPPRRSLEAAGVPPK